MKIDLNENERLFLLKVLWDINLIVNFKEMSEKDKNNFIKMNVRLSDILRGLK
jgi:hypothetical protein